MESIDLVLTAAIEALLQIADGSTLVAGAFAAPVQNDVAHFPVSLSTVEARHSQVTTLSSHFADPKP